MAVAERIKQRRMELSISQTDLAEEVGITKQQMYKYENGIITNIPSDKIEAIATALKTSPAYLMGWDNDSGFSFNNNISSNNENIVKIAGRDGSYIEKKLSDKQIAALKIIIDQLPEADDL